MSFLDLILIKLILDLGVELYYVCVGIGFVFIMIYGVMGDW